MSSLCFNSIMRIIIFWLQPKPSVLVLQLGDSNYTRGYCTRVRLIEYGKVII